MNVNKIQLSICIPTYNGGDRINLCLDRVMNSVKEFSDVEIIVSDNCSTDNTPEVLSTYKDPRIRIFRNEENLGYSGNMRLLIDKYSRGEYCWIIGDDDLLDSDAISKVFEVISKYQPEFIFVNHRLMSLESTMNLSLDESRSLDVVNTSFFECLDENATPGNILGTFISSHIFRLNRIKAFDKSIFGSNTWTDFRTTFPNSFMMTETFWNDTNCACIKTPLITAVAHPKSWDDKMIKIIYYILPDYYCYCMRLSGNSNQLKRNKSLINKMCIKHSLSLIKKLKINKVSFIRLFKSIFGLL